jgi:hypothetical protein
VAHQLHCALTYARGSRVIVLILRTFALLIAAVILALVVAVSIVIVISIIIAIMLFDLQARQNKPISIK